MNPYTDFPSNIEGIIKRRLRKGKYARRCELARKWLGVVIVVGALLVYVITQ